MKYILLGICLFFHLYAFDQELLPSSAEQQDSRSMVMTFSCHDGETWTVEYLNWWGRVVEQEQITFYDDLRVYLNHDFATTIVLMDAYGRR